MKGRSQKCVRCGSPCRVSLFSTSEGCSNARCIFFDGREVLDMMEEAQRLLREAGLC